MIKNVLEVIEQANMYGKREVYTGPFSLSQGLTSFVQLDLHSSEVTSVFVIFVFMQLDEQHDQYNMYKFQV